jgi:hypothetical protein
LITPQKYSSRLNICRCRAATENKILLQRRCRAETTNKKLLPRRDGNRKKVKRAALATVTLKISGFLSLLLI